MFSVSENSFTEHPVTVSTYHLHLLGIYIYRASTISTQYLFGIYTESTISTQYLFGIYNIYTVCSLHWPGGCGHSGCDPRSRLLQWPAARRLPIADNKYHGQTKIFLEDKNILYFQSFIDGMGWDRQQPHHRKNISLLYLLLIKMKDKLYKYI